MNQEEKEDLVQSVIEDRTFRKLLNRALSIPTECIVNDIVLHDEEITTNEVINAYAESIGQEGHIKGTKKKFRIPTELRDREKENKLVSEVIDGFDFDIVKDVTRVLPVLNQEDYGYFEDIETFKKKQLMVESARRLLEQALDAMWEEGRIVCDELGDMVCICETVRGQFSVYVEFDIEDKEYYGSLTYDIAESSNF